MKVDLVIVGASFAGLSCAYKALLAGLSVVVLEKKEAAGDKLHTTGIFVKEALEQTACMSDAPQELFRFIEKVRLYAPNLHSLDLYAPDYYFATTNTPDLLNWLAQKVLKLGGTVLHSTLFKTAQYIESIDGDGAWRIPVASHAKGDGTQEKQENELQARYLIGADGPTSRVARELNLSVNTEFLYGEEKEYPQVDLDENCLHCFIDKTLAAGYIGWAAPSQGYYQVGLARRLPSQKNTKQSAGAIAYAQFVNKISPFVNIQSEPMGVRAGLIPCGGTLRHISCPNAMLVGDAAGTVSPVTAGGIHTAILYGEQAGAAVADYLQGRAADPAGWLVKQYPQFKTKRILRQCFDWAQQDWMFNMALKTAPFRRFAEQVYFHKKGGASKDA